jgi:ubiquinone/menaquinone biosynthesis C-methylase UbiE
MDKSRQNWTNFSLDKMKDNFPVWPIEVMVKVLFGEYLKGEKPTLDKDKKVLDVGCGFGNNLLPFLLKGCHCSGVEITNEMAKIAQDTLHSRGFNKVEINKGSNRSLPYENNTFDLLISNNVIHYESNENDYINALKEYARVLKPGGGLYLMTVGPEHDIYKKAKIIGAHTFKIQNWDFRDGESYFYLTNQKYLKFFLDNFFIKIETGRVTEKLMNVNLDFLVAFCRKA